MFEILSTRALILTTVQEKGKCMKHLSPEHQFSLQRGGEGKIYDSQNYFLLRMTHTDEQNTVLNMEDEPLSTRALVLTTVPDKGK